jgi:hypothetical protein
MEGLRVRAWWLAYGYPLSVIEVLVPRSSTPAVHGVLT